MPFMAMIMVDPGQVIGLNIQMDTIILLASVAVQ